MANIEEEIIHEEHLVISPRFGTQYIAKKNHLVTTMAVKRKIIYPPPEPKKTLLLFSTKILSET